jgi:hypothetical protein
LLGATDKEIADFFNISEATVNNWKLEHPRFLESIRKGKQHADMEIAKSLYDRAKGCTVLTQQAFKVKKGTNNEEVEVVDVMETYPPDPVCIKYFLNNRRPDRWKDKTEIEHSGDNQEGLQITFVDAPSPKPINAEFKQVDESQEQVTSNAVSITKE